ncbi:hypothetical protein AJ80_06032 [Polytolypa hystricis UAMH7299]|uniref:Deacetylase sirtuin-type domain-containing protein n=1 Tax=Polytolypa hystricis (strain UAMH7299) TaxID=1447883 RepID=A0A2B7XZF8_POLH7|nr:hypothetical protein AJ80_06032 [Polytolypa hystricis UAMH7299]
MPISIDPQHDISDYSSDLSSLSPSPQLCPLSPSSDLDTSLRLPDVAQNPTTSKNGPPLAKRRRRAEPKPRTTMHLNLTPSAVEDQSSQLELLLRTLRKKQKIVVIAGAGISVSAGIPDFRSSHGLFTTLKKDHKLKTSGKQLFDASVYRDQSLTSSFHDMVRSLSNMASVAQPTAFHHLLARLAKDGRLMRLYTQNVDGIDTSLPPLATEIPLAVKAPWPRTIQLHGGLEKMVCQKCRHTADFEPHLFDGPDPPLCPECVDMDAARTTGGQRSHGVGKLRPRIVLYNEHNPDEEAIGSVVTADLRTRPDALIVVGTSLKIPGVRRIVKEMTRVVRGRRDGITMWINHDNVPVGKDFESCWDLVIKGDCDEVARHAGVKAWNDDAVHDCSPDEVASAKENRIVSVVVPPGQTPKKEQSYANTGVLTPASSQDEDSIDYDKALLADTKPLTDSSDNRVLSVAIPLGKPRKPKQTKKPTARKAPAKTKKVEDRTQRINDQFKVSKTAAKSTVTSKKPGRPSVADTAKAVQSKSSSTESKNTLMFPNLGNSSTPSQRVSIDMLVNPTEP